MGSPDDLLSEWALTPDGVAQRSSRALVVPVRTESGRAAVLRVAAPDEDSALSHLALRHWNGHGAANLLRADPHRGALLLERLGTDDLTSVWDLTACEVIGELYAKLHIPAPPQLRRLPDLVRARADQLRGSDGPLPRRMVEQALSLSADLAADPASAGTLVHTDLHHGNVLAAGEDWAAVSPKPLSGDPHYEPAPALIAHWAEVTDDVRFGVRRRFDTLVDVAGLDEDRARAWVIVRMAHRAIDPATTRDTVTNCVAVIKAVQG